MQVIFEVASCPWKDDLSMSHKKETSPFTLSLTSEKLPLIYPSRFQGLLMWSMLLRKQYGGLACDMQMLGNYVEIWGRRFTEKVEKDIIKRLFPKDSSDQKNWEEIPSLIYDPIRIENSSKLVLPMMTEGKFLTALNISDITPAGIDFHCSNVLQHLLSEKNIYEKICDKMIKLGLNEKKVAANRKEHVMVFLQKCMWRFSSSISNKTLISGKKLCHSEDLYHIWEVVIPGVTSYTSRYLAAKLVS